MQVNKPASVYPLFSKLIYVKETNIDTSKILKVVKKKNWVIAGEKDSVSHHADKSTDLNVLDKPDLKFAKDHIYKYINEYNKTIMKYKNDLVLTRSWFTRTETDKTSDYHSHNNSFISAVLYLKPPKDGAKIGFVDYSIKRFVPDVIELNMWNSSAYSFQPTDGMLIIFPSDVFHKVLPHTSKQTRYSLAINYMPVGKIGREFSDSFVNIHGLDGKS